MIPTQFRRVGTSCQVIVWHLQFRKLSAAPLCQLGPSTYRHLTRYWITSHLICPSLFEPITPLPIWFPATAGPCSRCEPLAPFAHLPQMCTQREAPTVWSSLHTPMTVSFPVLVCLCVLPVCLDHHSEFDSQNGGASSVVQSDLWQIRHQQPSHQMAYPHNPIPKAYGPQLNHLKSQQQGNIQMQVLGMTGLWVPIYAHVTMCLLPIGTHYHRPENSLWHFPRNKIILGEC